LADEINLANQKAGDALRNSSVDGPRKEWGNQYLSITGRIQEDDTAETLYLNAAGYDALEETVDRLLKVDNFAQAVGRHAIATQLADFLCRYHGRAPQGGLLSVFKREVVEPLRQSIYGWICLIPLVNFRVEKPLTIGTVTFLSKQDACRELQGAAGTARADVLLEELERVEDEDRVDAFAKVNINAHQMQRVRLAEETVLITINMLRAFAPRLNPFNHALLCGLRTEVPRNEKHSVLSIRVDTDIVDIRHDIEDSVLGNFCVYEETLRQLRAEYKFDTLIAVAAKPPGSRTSLEDAIFTSVQTLGQSMVAGSTGRAFSGCIAALECLAKPADERCGIKATFATNLRKLFGSYRKAEDAYALRSAFVHTGFADIAVEDLRASRRCAIDLVILVLSKASTIQDHHAFIADSLGS
jgi:hypothetical protein